MVKTHVINAKIDHHHIYQPGRVDLEEMIIIIKNGYPFRR